MKCVDIVAFSQNMNDVFLLGCTTDVIKDDLDKLFEISEKLSARMTDYKIHPIVVTNLKKNEIRSLEEAYKNETGILSSEILEKILELNKDGRSNEKIARAAVIPLVVYEDGGCYGARER